MPGEYPVIAFVARPSERLRRSVMEFGPAFRSKRNNDGSLSFTLPGEPMNPAIDQNESIMLRRSHPIPDMLKDEEVDYILQARELSGKGRRWYESVITGYNGQPIRPFIIKPPKPQRHSLVMFSGVKLGRVGLFLHHDKYLLFIDRARCRPQNGHVIVMREVILSNFIVSKPPGLPVLPARIQPWKPAVEAVYRRSQCNQPGCRSSHYSAYN